MLLSAYIIANTCIWIFFSKYNVQQSCWIDELQRLPPPPSPLPPLGVPALSQHVLSGVAGCLQTTILGGRRLQCLLSRFALATLQESNDLV